MFIMKKHDSITLGSLFCLIILISIGTSNNSVIADDELNWDVYQLTDNNFADEHPVIVIDDEDAIHVAWAGGTKRNQTVEEDLDVYYGIKKVGHPWEIVQLTDNNVHDLFPKLDVDSTGVAHLVWWSNVPDTSNEIFYATNPEGTWQITTVTQDNANDIRPSIAVDKDGIAHIAWQRQGSNSRDIFYGRRENDSWVIEQVTKKSTDCFSPSIVFDSTNTPYIAWYEQSDDQFSTAEIFYGIQSEPQWRAFRVTGNDFGERDPILIFDSLDQPHIVWTGQTDNNDVYYGFNTESCSCRPWEVTPLTQGQSPDEEPRMFVGSDGTPHFVWERDNMIYYSKGISTGSGDQAIPITTGHNPWIYVDPDDVVYITYFDTPQNKELSEIYLTSTQPIDSSTSVSTITTPVSTITSISNVDEFLLGIEGLLLVMGLVLVLNLYRKNYH